jgi:hypothetical protein
MNCLVCGHKLAIFRKLSLGDFCCQEHRSLFAKQQSDRGLARLMDTNSQSRNRAVGMRLYSQFLLDEVPPIQAGLGYLGHGPLAPKRILAPATSPSLHRVTSARRTPFTEFFVPQRGPVAALGSEEARRSVRLPGRIELTRRGGAKNLQPAGLILPWSSGAGSHTVFSLAPLAAAAWAQSGFCKPINHGHVLGSLQFSWPGMEGALELPPAVGIAPAAFTTVAAASQPMRVRLATPLVASHKPMLELPVPARVEECPPEPVTSASAAPAPSSRVPARRSLFATIFAPQPRLVAARERVRPRDRDVRLGYDETGQVKQPTASEAWKAMFAGWTPSAAGVSAVFAILFLFSAITIFLSAPSTMSYRGPSFRWGNLRTAIRNRAVLKVEDDFRAGLNGWSFPKGWSQDWSYDQAGFLRPGKLGFLDKSMKLVNYRLELMGQIERKSLGWAFRAKDSNNYYVAKLMIARPGPLPIVDLIHYPVLNGKEGAKVRVTLPFAVRNDTLYQVEMNVRGDAFRASVNGHVVDSWNDNALRAGGVGFVSGQGEAARVRWIRVSDRDDVIGRVCSYLSARAAQSSDDDPVLSASYYMIFRHPGTAANF